MSAAVAPIEPSPMALLLPQQCGTWEEGGMSPPMLPGQDGLKGEQEAPDSPLHGAANSLLG